MTEAERQAKDYAEVRLRLFGQSKCVNVRPQQKYAARRIEEIKAERAAAEKRRREEAERKRIATRTSKTPEAYANITWASIKPQLVVGRWSMNDVADYVLDYFPGLTVDSIRDATRRKYEFHARKVLATAIRDLRPDVSFPQIGRFLNRDHTTIMSMLGLTTKKRVVSEK